jgi:hypothetical protein
MALILTLLIAFTIFLQVDASSPDVSAEDEEERRRSSSEAVAWKITIDKDDRLTCAAKDGSRNMAISPAIDTESKGTESPSL